jgi:hypothetical protein
VAALRAHPLKPDSASTCSQAVWPQSPRGSPLYPEVSVLVPRWAQKQESWRFQKTRQTWLLLHMYDEDKVCAHGWAKGGWGAVGHSGHRVSAWQVGTWVSGSMHSTWTTKQSS